MTIKTSRWGFSVNVGGLAVEAFVGELYLRLPKIGELAWNGTGLYCNRIA